MKRSASAIVAMILTFSLGVSTIAQTLQRRQGLQPTSSPSDQGDTPALIIISDRQLTNYGTQRNGDEYTITIYQVGNFETASNGQAYRQKQPAGTNDLIIAFRLREGTSPQLFQRGNELRIFFSSQGAPPSSFIVETTTSAQPQAGNEVIARAPDPSATEVTRGTNMSQSSAVVLTGPIERIEPLGIEARSDGTSIPDACEKFNYEPGKDDPKDELVVIDANTGKILEGATHVHEHTRVKVAFVNKNPFKYDYNFQLIPKDVGNATVISFLGLIPGFSSIPSILPASVEPSVSNAQFKANKAAALSTPSARSMSPSNASDCQAFADRLGDVVSNGENIAKALKEANGLLKNTSDAYAAFLKATDTVPNGGTAQARIKAYKALCDVAAKTLPELKKVLDIDFDAFSKGLKLDVFSAQVALLENDLSSSGCDAVTKGVYGKAIGALKTDIGTYRTRLDDLKKAVADSQKKLEAPAKIIAAALGSSNSFAEAAYAPSLGDATSVSINITRKNLRDENPKEEIVAVSQPIEIGEPRVVLSGGFGFSTINERTIIRQQSLVPGPDGTSVIGNRFGFENRSQFRPSGLLLLNGLITRFPLFGRQQNATFALSAGLVFSDRNDGLATEFVAGPSLGLANNKLFLTFGFHAARVQELGGGFKIGDPVPRDLADPLPIEKNWRNGLMMALTFKFLQPK